MPEIAKFTPVVIDFLDLLKGTSAYSFYLQKRIFTCPDCNVFSLNKNINCQCGANAAQPENYIGGSGEKNKISIEYIPDPEKRNVILKKTFSKSEIIIGRKKNCDIVLTEYSVVSENHCSIIFRNNEWILRDNGSKNGTYIGDNQVETEIILKKKDVIRLASEKKGTFLRVKF